MDNTLILSCSHRKNSVSKQVADVCQERIKIFSADTQATTFDFGENPLPMWNEEVWNESPQWQQDLAPLREAAEACDSLIVIVPEYAGMVAPMAKNVMLFLTTELIGHKPAVLVGISAGIGGSYPIAEMRMSGYKNNRILWLPDHTIIRSAGDFKAPFESARQKESLEHLDHSIKMLSEYAKVLPAVRSSQAFINQPFPFGM
jgi:NAD(P)H-dependent FMN reductase